MFTYIGIAAAFIVVIAGALVGMNKTTPTSTPTTTQQALIGEGGKTVSSTTPNTKP